MVMFRAPTGFRLPVPARWRHSCVTSLPAGLNVDSLPTETVWTTGINFYLNPRVVLKADYQHFSGDYPGDVNQNRFDLGLGLEF